MRVLLFGTGGYYQLYKLCFKDVEVVGLLDNNVKKQGLTIDGYSIYPPEKVLRLAFDQVWLLCRDTSDMRKQLISLGVSNDVVFDVWDLGRALRDQLVVPNGKYYVSSESYRVAISGDAVGKTVILTPNLLLNGAEIALMQFVKVILCLGYKPLVASLNDGPLREELLALDVPVVLMGEVAHEVPLSCLSYLAGARAYILNTIEMYLLLQNRDESIPIAWWLHDSELIYKDTHIIDEALRNLDLSGVDIYVVSSVAANAFRQHYCKNVLMTEMAFGLFDWAEKVIGQRKDLTRRAFTFSMVGNLSILKAQNVFINAIKILPEKIIQNCRFCIIGSESNKELVDTLKSQAKDITNINFMGEKGHDELLRFYAEEMDVLVCPSLSDSLPIVTVEAMMFSRPVIVSTAVGTEPLILSQKAGLSVPVGDHHSLAEAMQWIYEHSYNCISMGKRGRKLYEENFSIKSFQAKVSSLMQKLIGIA